MPLFRYFSLFLPPPRALLHTLSIYYASSSLVPVPLPPFLPSFTSHIIVYSLHPSLFVSLFKPFPPLSLSSPSSPPFFPYPSPSLTLSVRPSFLPLLFFPPPLPPSLSSFPPSPSFPPLPPSLPFLFLLLLPPLPKPLPPIQSANFGKGFLGPDVPMEVVNMFVEMCHQLRVLNNVREEEIGIPITYKQYYRLSTEVLVDR